MLKTQATWRSLSAVATVLAVLSLTLTDTAASADPVVDSQQPLATATAPDGSRLEKVTVIDGRTIELSVFAASMQRSVSVRVQRPADTSRPHPTLYMLDGENRRQVSDAMSFLANKEVNVVIPTGGENAYWTDWIKSDPALGNNKWKTFLTEELPPIIDASLGTNGVNAIEGMSRTGTAALQLAAAAPGLYRAVASYSACPQTSDPIGQNFVRLSMEQYGGGNPDNMWGAANDPNWAANDPYVNAEKLRGTDLYISSGGGLPGQHDRLDDPFVHGDVSQLAKQVFAGGVIEAATNYCNHQFANKLTSLNIPATYGFPLTGNHSWGYWADAFKDSWPVLARGMGI